MTEEPTIQLNHRPYPLREGTTVSSLMEENNFKFSHIVVKIDGVVIDEENWRTKTITAGNIVEMIHIFGGG